MRPLTRRPPRACRELLRALVASALCAGCASPTGDTAACPGECLEVSPRPGDATGPSPYPDADAAPPDALPRAAPPGWPPPRPLAQTCRLPAVPPLAPMRAVPAFPGLVFEKPLWFGYAPGDGARRYVVEQGGRIWVFEGRQDVAGAAPFLQLNVSTVHAEEGLLGLAFHPRFAENRRFFVYYSAPVEDPADRHTVLSAFVADPGGDPERTAATKQVLLSVPQPYGNHKGGALEFGPDGHLYLGLGDGGSGGDPHDNAQNPDVLLGKVLRLDVDAGDPVCLTLYGIPEDNPFAEGRCGPGARGRPEIFAWGVRNPWRMAFDTDTGLLWAGDVGQDEWEEVSVIRRGRNYGWRRVEGEVCFRPADCDPADFEPPVYVYPHSEGKSITGGFVYRGRAFPELYGAYLYADYANGAVYALRVDERGGAAATRLAETGTKLVSLGRDPDGEPYIVAFGGRSLFTLARAEGVGAPPALPATLSATGCYADPASGRWAEGVVPYDINAPLWSDGAAKTRAFALPAGLRARFSSDGHIEFPEGSVLLKTFAFGAAARPIETRLLLRTADGWQGYSYRWRADGRDADLLDGPADAAVESPEGPSVWSFPSRAQCNDCHTQAAGGSLGPTFAQWSRPAPGTGLPGGPDAPDGLDGLDGLDQIDALVAAGYLEGPPAEVRALARFPAPDDPSAELGARARALLDANCAHCHRPDGPAVAQIDLRATTPLARTGLCDAPPGQGDLGLPDARLLAPGEPDRSVLWARMARRGEFQMPPLGSAVVDRAGVDLVRAFIVALGGAGPGERCP